MTNRSRYTYNSPHDNLESCLVSIFLIVITLIPAAIISVLGNILFPQYHFTLLGGFAIVVGLRWFKALI